MLKKKRAFVCLAGNEGGCRKKLHALGRARNCIDQQDLYPSEKRKVRKFQEKPERGGVWGKRVCFAGSF